MKRCGKSRESGWGRWCRCLVQRCTLRFRKIDKQHPAAIRGRICATCACVRGDIRAASSLVGAKYVKSNDTPTVGNVLSSALT